MGRKVKQQEVGEIDPVDMFVKTKVVSDAINLTREDDRPEQFNSLQQIFPCPEDEQPYECNQIMETLKKAFYNLVPEDKLDHITTGQFQKLIDHPFFSTKL